MNLSRGGCPGLNYGQLAQGDADKLFYLHSIEVPHCYMYLFVL